MTDLRCTTPNYDTLYTRWLENPGQLLDLAGWEPGMKLMDLCGGTGAVSLEALRRGADPEDITLVDIRPRCPDDRIHQEACKAENIGFVFDGRWGEWDVIVCRQAMAYLNIDRFSGASLFGSINGLLKSRGVFAFNTFVKPRWAIKRYRYAGVQYVEASGYLGRTVWHLQGALGIGWDATKFHWHEDQQIRDWLGAFDVTTVTSGRSQRWLCKKRS
jgi:hypothetical protein